MRHSSHVFFVPSSRSQQKITACPRANNYLSPSSTSASSISQPHPAFPQPVAPVLPCLPDSSGSSAGLVSCSPQEGSSHLTWQPLVFTSQFLSVAPPLPPLAPPQLLSHSDLLGAPRQHSTCCCCCPARSQRSAVPL